jgi:RNA polymerase sigma-70 factor (ECF subfamily)
MECPLSNDNAATMTAQEIGSLLMRYEHYLLVLAARQIPRRIRDRVDPADVVQTTLMHASEFLASDSLEVVKIASFLRTILRRAIHDACRTHYAGKRSVKREDRAENAIWEVASASVRPEDELIVRESVAALMEAMASLSAIHAEVLRLSYFEGLGRAEIAKRIGRSELGAAALLKRAKASLRETMIPVAG